MQSSNSITHGISFRTNKNWFYIRKAIFLVVLPILLALITFVDFIDQTPDDEKRTVFGHLYFYTFFILFIHTQMQKILKYIYSVCSENVIFRKQIDVNNSTPDLLLTLGFTNSDDHHIIVIKKIFKLKYCNSKFFSTVSKISWILGIDCPTLIPFEVVARLTNIKNPTFQNEDPQILYAILNNLYTYDPVKYNKPVEMSLIDDGNLFRSTHDQPLVPRMVISELDQSISVLQKEIFNLPIRIENANV